jgi:hypothetical protein
MRTPSVDHPDCVDVREALSKGDILSAAAQAHADGCAVCAAFRAKTGPELESPDALFAAIEASVKKERGPTGWLRSLPTEHRIAIASGFCVVLVALTAFATPRTAFGPLPMARVGMVMAVLAFLLVGVLRLGLRPLQALPVGRDAILTSFGLGLIVPILFALLPRIGAPVESIPNHTSCTATFGCFIIGAVPGALLLLALRALDRGAHQSIETALLAAVAGGLVGNAALELHCPITTHFHLLVGHATVGVALVLIYAIIVKSRPTKTRSR